MDIPVIYPMNAKSAGDNIEDLLKDGNHWVAEEKYDGSRYLMYITPDGNRFFSRKQSVTTGLPVEKTNNVPHLRDLKFELNGLTVLDGEIITGEGCSSNDVVSIMGSLPERALLLQSERGKVKYVAFDILYLNGENIMDKPWIHRRFYLNAVLEEHLPIQINCEFIRPSKVVGSNKEEFLNSIMDKGGEGIILKNTQATYIPDKRPSNTWVKIKKYDTYDVVITGYDEPKEEYEGKYPDDWQYWKTSDGKIHFSKESASKSEFLMYPVTRFYALGWIGAIKFGQYNENKELIEIGQTSGMDDSLRQYISENRDSLLGKVIEVGAMERIKKTSALRHPRFIRFREDKNPRDCVIGES